MAALGEELGYIGFATVAVLFAILVWRLLRIAVRAPGDYTAFLTIGLTLALAVQALVIVARHARPAAARRRGHTVFELWPFGDVEQLRRARRLRGDRAAARTGARGVRATGARARLDAGGRGLLIVVVRAPTCRSSTPTRFATRANLTQQADGGYRYQYNPRLASAARRSCEARSSIATACRSRRSRPDEIEKFAAHYQKLGLDLPDACRSGRERCYPLGSLAFHVLGDATRQTNWAARNTSYVEKDFDARLKGFDDRPQTIDVTNRTHGDQRTPSSAAIIRSCCRSCATKATPDTRTSEPDSGARSQPARDDRRRPAGADGASAARSRRSCRLDARGRRRHRPGDRRAAGVGELSLAGRIRARRRTADPAGRAARSRPLRTLSAGLDLQARDRGGRAAHRVRGPAGAASSACACRMDASAGRVRGASRPVRDDPLDHTPHGTVDLHRGLVVSCNAYFSNLANLIGPQVLERGRVRSADRRGACRRPPRICDARCRTRATDRVMCWPHRCGWPASPARWPRAACCERCG